MKTFFKEANFYLWDNSYLFKRSPGGLVYRCVTGTKAENIMWHCHSLTYGGHRNGEMMITKVLQSGFWWQNLFQDCKSYVITCPECNKISNISKRDEMSLNIMLEVELFDCWGIDFRVPFPQSNNNLYILECVDYVTKWVEVNSCNTNDVRIVTDFLKNNDFARFGVPKVLISDGGTHF